MQKNGICFNRVGIMCLQHMYFITTGSDVEEDMTPHHQHRDQ